MKIEKFTHDNIKVGDIVLIADTLTGGRYNDSMIHYARHLARVTRVEPASNEYGGSITGYLKLQPYPITTENSGMEDWCWYPEHIAQILTKEEDIAVYQAEMDNNPDYIKCDICNTYELRDNIKTHNGKQYCSHCTYTHLHTCKYCGKIFDKNDPAIHRLNYRKHICDTCTEEHEEEIFWCDYHDRWEEVDIYDPMSTPHGEMWCADSFYDEFCTCDICGEVMSRDYAYWDEDSECYYCDSCWDERCAENCYTRVMEYHTRVKTKYGTVKDNKIVYDDYDQDFKGYGIELEVDTADTTLEEDRDTIASELSDMTNRAFYYQTDGSLSDDGIEIISHPHTKEALDLLPLEDMCKYLVGNGLRGHQAGHCGLHIHISRKLFGDTEEEQDNNILKMVQFYHSNWDDIAKFSRRRDFGYCHKLPVNNDEELKDFVVKKGANHSRYVAINLTNRRADTVEVRIMRSTLNAHTLRATLDFVAHIAERSLTIADSDIKNPSVWLEGISTRCIDYMKIRGCFGYTLDTLNEEV